MSSWFLQFIISVVPEVVRRITLSARRQQLAKDFDEIKKMDIPENEKRALRKALVKRYNDGK